MLDAAELDLGSGEYLLLAVDQQFVIGIASAADHKARIWRSLSV